MAEKRNYKRPWNPVALKPSSPPPIRFTVYALVMALLDSRRKAAQMNAQPEISVPAHLTDLLEPTPSGTAKFIAAWDGLSPETQILLLLERCKRPGPAHLYHRLICAALKSRNAYVRYLAAKEARTGAYGNEIADVERHVAADAEPLVKYALLESKWSSLDPQMKDPDSFFALPHEARLAKVRQLTGDGEIIANIISHGIDHKLKDGKVSQTEIFDILTEYLVKPGFRQRYADDPLNYEGGVDIGMARTFKPFGR